MTKTIRVSTEDYKLIEEYMHQARLESMQEASHALLNQKGQGQEVVKEVIKEIPVEKIVYRDREPSTPYTDTSKKIYACSYCREQYTDKDACLEHQSIHLKAVKQTQYEPPKEVHDFVCVACLLTFGSWRQVKEHIEDMHAVIRHLIPIAHRFEELKV